MISRPCCVEHAALPVGDGDDLRSLFREQLGRDRSDVAEALYGHRRAFEREAEVLDRFARHDHDAAAGGFAPPQRAAELDRLAGHDGRRGVADVHRVGVHHPGHDLLVGVHVRRRHVLFRTDRVDDFGDVAPRQRFDLALATSSSDRR